MERLTFRLLSFTIYFLFRHVFRVMKVLILGYQNRAGVPETVRSLRPMILQHAQIAGEDLTGTADLSDVEADIALVFGGDGSILRAVQQMGRRQLPVLSINLGRLGFLAGLSRDDDLSRILGQLHGLSERLGSHWLDTLRARSSLKLAPNTHLFSVSEYQLLNCTIFQSVNTPEETQISSLIMNEIAIQSADFHIIEVQIWADDERLTSCRCDGMILSTPMGSTAHNLSVGGPILRPGLDAVVISPIAPHTMTFRPVVDSSRRTYRFRLDSSGGNTAVVVDGRLLAHISSRDRIEVFPSDVHFQIINVPGVSYYSKLQEKLGWGGQLK